MRPSIRLGRIFGIDIGLHYSLGVIALLIVFSLAGHFQFVNPGWTARLRWSLAGLTTLLFFASILAHELSHAAIGKARGIEVKSITLFALGGVANMEREPSDAASEFWMAIAGPSTSVVIGLLFLGIARVAGWQPQSGTPPAPLEAGLVWLGYINVALAIFNMIPGYPLDGGRVLRAVVWRINSDLTRATRFVIKPQGVCRDLLCFPLPRNRKAEFIAKRGSTTWFNLSEFARLIKQACTSDQKTGVWYFGPLTEERNGYIASLTAPDFTLPDLNGRSHSLKEFRGKKVLLVTWASW